MIISIIVAICYIITLFSKDNESKNGQDAISNDDIQNMPINMINDYVTTCLIKRSVIFSLFFV